MNKFHISFYGFFLIITMLFLAACNDDKNSPEPGPPGPEIPEPENPAIESKADLSFDAFNETFLIKKGNTNYYKEDLYTDEKEYFWCQALIILMVEDTYDRNPKDEYKTLIRNLLNTFLQQNKGSRDLYDWDWNEFNDDLLWAALAFIRGYQITGDKVFLDQATYAYNRLYTRGWDEKLGGGIWWDIRKDNKSGLSNNPAVTLACYLYEATQKKEYLTQAIQIYDWIYETLFDKETGAVYENIRDNGYIQKEGADNVYNSGAFIEAAAHLYHITGDSWYFNDAKMAINYILNNKTENGILSRGNRDGTWQSEFARGMGIFVKNNNLWNEYYDWMKKNADAAWNTRREDLNLTWNKWTERTPRENLRAVECVSAVVMLQVVPEENPLK